MEPQSSWVCSQSPIWQFWSIYYKIRHNTQEYIICGDINIDYLVDSDRKIQLEALLKTYNLKSVVNFPTHTSKICQSYWQYLYWHYQNGELVCMSNNKWAVRPWCSVHDITFFQSETTHKKFLLIGKINERTINDILIKLSYETWDTIFSTDDVNKMF
jgi:hypothetical protein